MFYANGQPVGGGGGGNAKEMELTYAEYMALSEEQKTDGTTYYIIDINGDGSNFQPVIYSTEEREVGVWTDGKPIYKQSFLYSTPISLTYNSWINTNVPNTLDIEKIVYREVIAGADHYTVCEVGLGAGGHYVGIRNDMNAVRSMSALTLYYTKTSDAAGSGTWTPQGVPAVHYSTDEQVIGTWINGETLYQKTLHISNVQFDSTGVYDLDLTSMGTDILIADNSCSYYTFSTYVRNFEKLVPEDGHIYCYGVANRSITDGYITIKYTKSS